MSDEELPCTSVEFGSGTSSRNSTVTVNGSLKCLRLELSLITTMADVAVMQPKSMMRPKVWDEEVEEAYRFQLAGYRDAIEYKQVKNTEHIDRWPHNGYVKKLQRRDGCFYYYNKTRECPDKEIHKTKVYSY
ncbi:meiosis expressed gene 1 protein homolog isoform X1 [Littorina saxatilis]|uniref:Meiosis expressed gene 1 protein homolog n=2 Tax=Littorina saxatilis TaxID=31220 RepID=A0AAN9GB60_9CAEN